MDKQYTIEHLENELKKRDKLLKDLEELLGMDGLKLSELNFHYPPKEIGKLIKVLNELNYATLDNLLNHLSYLSEAAIVAMNLEKVGLSLIEARQKIEYIVDMTCRPLRIEAEKKERQND